jgi:hypothetical protein
MIARMTVFGALVIAFSIGSVMTATNAVSDSRAGIAAVPVEVGCAVVASVSFSPNNMNRSSAAHHTLTATVVFPGGLPDGVTPTGVVLRLSGGAQAIAPDSGGGPAAFTFSRADVLGLVGPVNGNFTLEIAGQIGNCQFAASDTIRVSGLIS